MKFLRLDLKAVGPFTDTRLDFSGTAEGPHLVVGVNEAGKTSALRALSHLLFGFPHQTPDNFRHHYDALRVGGSLLARDGEVMEVVRRKGKKDTLRTADESAAVSEAALGRLLGDVDQATFEGLFGIDHARLRQAGEEVREGRGLIGELLFAAGGGLLGLRAIQKDLQKRCDALYVKKGQVPRINAALTQHDELVRDLKRRQLSSEDWQRHEAALKDAQRRREKLEKDLDDRRRARDRFQRLRNAVVPVAQRRRLGEQLRALGDVVELHDGFGDEVREAFEVAREARTTIEGSTRRIAQLDAKLEEVVPSPPLLDEAHAIEALQERLGAEEKASSDRRRIEGFKDEDEHVVRDLLRKLGRTPELGEAESLTLLAHQPAEVRELAKKFETLTTRADDARKAIERQRDLIERRERELAELADIVDVTALRREVRRARRAGDLDEAHAKAVSTLRKAEKRTMALRPRLVGWRGTDSQLRALATPMAETVDRLEDEAKRLDERERSLELRRGPCELEVHQVEEDLRALELDQDVPSEADLNAARRDRLEGWELVRGEWLGQPGAAVAAAQRFLAEQAPGRTLAEAYERAVERADLIADRLRREAERVARKSAWRARLDQLRQTLGSLDVEREALETRRSLFAAQWRALVAPFGAELASPRELRAWLRAREELIDALDNVDEVREQSEALASRREDHRTAVRNVLIELGHGPGPRGEEVGPLLDHAEALMELMAETAKKRAGLDAKLGEARFERDNARKSLATTEEDLAVWKTEWRNRMVEIGLKPDASPIQAEAFLGHLQQIQERLQKVRGHVKRLDGIDRDARQFAEEVRSLAGRLAADLIDQPTADVARELARRLRLAQDIEKERSILSQQRAEAVQEREQAELRAAGASDRSRDLCIEARCEKPEELADSDRRWREWSRLRRELDALDEQLVSLAFGRDLSAFVLEVEGCDPVALDHQFPRVEEEIQTFEGELAGVHQLIGEERNALDNMNGGEDGAVVAGDVQSLLAKLQGDVERYANLKLALAVLRRGIESYRARNQGPILERASALFASLTDGSFARLEIEDDNGQAVLRGSRPDGRVVSVAAMSDGTHDQLYLALRIAVLEAWLQSHEPIPFVVDDVLVHFDDRRASAALKALADLSRLTQVLFFTHHMHLVEVARAALPPGSFQVHELRVSP